MLSIDSEKREQILLEKYATYINRNVDFFLAKGKSTTPEYKEDLRQEARIAFLKFIRERPDLTELDKQARTLCGYYMKHRMYEYSVRCRGIGLTRRTIAKNKDAFTVTNYESISEIETQFSYEETLMDPAYIALRDWVNVLSEDEREIINMRMEGYTDTQISVETRTPRTTIQTISKSIKTKYILNFENPKSKRQESA